MTTPILRTVFQTFNRHQRQYAPEGKVSLIKLVSTPYNLHGSDSVELLRIGKTMSSQHRLGSALALAISRDINGLLREYDADADRLHHIMHASDIADLDDAQVHIESVYMRSSVDLETTYVMVSDRGECLTLLTMKKGLTQIGPDQVEISVRQALARRDAVPSARDVLRHSVVQEHLVRYMNPALRSQNPV